MKKAKRYSIKKTTSGTCYVFDSERGVKILSSVTPMASYNVSVIDEVVDKLNSSQPQPVSVSEEVKDVLLKEKVSGRMTEATYRFLMRNIPTHQPTKIDEGEIERISEELWDSFNRAGEMEWSGFSKAIAKLINGGNEG